MFRAGYFHPGNSEVNSVATLETTNFVVTGVGGQGTILASEVIANVGLAAGYDVKKSEMRGVAQRSGSVLGHVRWGQIVQSPIVPEGCADYLVAFELLEGIRWMEQIRSGGLLLMNEQAIPPIGLAGEATNYPDRETIKDILNKADVRHIRIPALEMARKLGNPRVVNVILLGALSLMLPVADTLWHDVLRQHVPPQLIDLNLRAFDRGREWILDREKDAHRG